MARKDRIDFFSYDRKIEVQIGNGDHCVLLVFRDPGTRLVRDGVVLTDVEAEALALNIRRQARYSRRDPSS